MKNVTVLSSGCRYLNILNYGTEEIWQEAQWGPAIRNMHIIHYVLAGKGYYNGTPVEKGQGFLICANERAHYYSDPHEPWLYFWVIFTGEAADEVCREYLPLDKNGVFCYGDYTKLCKFVEQIMSEKTLSQPKALSAFYDLMSLQVRQTPITGNHYIADAKAHIHTRLHQPFSVSDIAAELGISDRYLYNLFIQYEGQSPKQYISEVKLQYAKNLLQNSTSSIGEVAASVGFHDVLAFSRFFSKKTGVCPSQYRKTS